MNILYVSQFLSTTTGGGEVVFYDWALEMAKRGHNVSVVCNHFSGSKDNNAELISYGMTIRLVKPIIKHKGGLPPSISQNMRFIFNAITVGSKIMKEKKIDIIHANNFASALAGSMLAKIHRVPIVITNHAIFTINSPDNWSRWAAQNKTSWLYSVIGPLFEKITVKVPADIIHTVSYAVKEDLIRFNVRHEIVVIHNGINLRNYDDLKFDSDHYQNYVLFIGRLVFSKNLDVVIFAFKNVIEKVPNAKLIVVGDGPMRDIWVRMVSKLGLTQNIEFTGFVSHKRKVELLSNCSLLLLPSFFEGFGLVLLEAFAKSKPVLVSDQRVFYEIVDEGINGFILPTHGAHEWAEKIIFLLSNRTICQDMGTNGRLKVENEFNIDHVMEKMELLYDRIISKKLECQSITHQDQT